MTNDIHQTSLADVYNKEYIETLSKAWSDNQDKFSALASPSLSRQETVTNLYKHVCELSISGRAQRFCWLSLVEFIPRLIVTTYRLILTSLKYRIRRLPQNAIYFRTWLEPRCVQGAALFDDFFRNLPDDLSRDNNVIVSFQPLDYSLLKAVRKLNRKNNYIVAVGLLSVFDILRLIVDYVLTARLRIKGNYSYEGRDITAAINQSLLLDYLRLRSFLAYEEKYICQKLHRFNLKAYIYVFENQSWEKVCCSILGRKGTRLVGYQSSGFSPIFLNFFPVKLDAETQPMPDVILTVGDLFTNYLVNNGNFDIPVRTFAALRFPHPNDGTRYAVLEPNPKLLKKIVYAFPVHISQYRTILDDLIKVFARTSIAVDLKCHPMFRREKISEFHSLPSNFNVVDQVDMSRLSDTYDCVLFNDNSFGIECLFMGVRSYQYHATKRFDDERFIYFDLWDTHLDYDGLLLLRDQILSGNYIKGYDASAVSDYLNSMYRPYNSDTRSFLNLINP